MPGSVLDWWPSDENSRPKLSLDWGDDLSEAKAIWVKGREGSTWVWQDKKEAEHGKKIETHDPGDRVGGPFHLTAFIDEGYGKHLYIFAVADSHFPIHDLVRADTFEDAYEIYVDWAAEHRHLAIKEEELKDYDPENLQYTSKGVPVDTDNIQGGEMEFLKADGVPEEEE